MLIERLEETIQLPTGFSPCSHSSGQEVYSCHRPFSFAIFSKVASLFLVDWKCYRVLPPEAVVSRVCKQWNNLGNLLKLWAFSKTQASLPILQQIRSQPRGVEAGALKLPMWTSEGSWQAWELSLWLTPLSEAMFVSFSASKQPWLSTRFAFYSLPLMSLALYLLVLLWFTLHWTGRNWGSCKHLSGIGINVITNR